MPIRNRSFVRLASIICALSGLVMAGPAQAANNTGTIVVINLTTNPNFPGRCVCIQMSPPIPTADQWGCLPLSSPLYKETTAVLLLAAQTQKTCVVAFSAAPSAWGGVGSQIDIVQCPYP